MDWLNAISVMALGMTTAILNGSGAAVGAAVGASVTTGASVLTGAAVGAAVGFAQAVTNKASKTSTTIIRLNIWFLLGVNWG